MVRFSKKGEKEYNGILECSWRLSLQIRHRTYLFSYTKNTPRLNSNQFLCFFLLCVVSLFVHFAVEHQPVAKVHIA